MCTAVSQLSSAQVIPLHHGAYLLCPACLCSVAISPCMMFLLPCRVFLYICLQPRSLHLLTVNEYDMFNEFSDAPYACFAEELSTVCSYKWT
jgi:hypothetical protein